MQGSQGIQGGAGAKGDTGLQGAPGESATTEVQFIEIPTFTLSSTASNSSAVGAFAAGVSYEFTALIYGEFSTQVADPGIGAEIVCLQACSYFRSTSIGSFGSFSKGIGLANHVYRVSFVIQGIITANDSSAKLQVNLFDVMESSSGNTMTFTGTFLIRKAGTLIR